MLNLKLLITNFINLPVITVQRRYHLLIQILYRLFYGQLIHTRRPLQLPRNQIIHPKQIRYHLPQLRRILVDLLEVPIVGFDDTGDSLLGFGGELVHLLLEVEAEGGEVALEGLVGFVAFLLEFGDRVLGDAVLVVELVQGVAEVVES
jgi:hypothetical protein